MLDLAAKENADAVAAEKEVYGNSETTAAKQFRSMKEAMNNGPTECLHGDVG